MKIRTDSWHYKLYRLQGGNVYSPTNLCQYLKTILFGDMTIFLAALTLLITLASAFSCHYLGTNWLNSVAIGIGILIAIPIALSIICLVFVGITLLVFTDFGKSDKCIVDRVHDTLLDGVDCVKNSKMKLVHAYLKAKKEKACPMVEFVDNQPK